MPYEYAMAEDESKVALFDKSMLWGNLKNLDITKYEEGNVLPDGTYSIDVIFNENPKGRYELAVNKNTEKNNSMPCVPRSLLLSFGVKETDLPITDGKDECINLYVALPIAMP